MNEKIYYYKDKKKRPIITVCLFENNGIVSRGLSICSVKDVPCKKIGRKIARQRAAHAMKVKKSTGEITRIEALIAEQKAIPKVDDFMLFKSDFDPVLTTFEILLLSPNERIT